MHKLPFGKIVSRLANMIKARETLRARIDDAQVGRTKRSMREFVLAEFPTLSHFDACMVVNYVVRRLNCEKRDALRERELRQLREQHKRNATLKVVVQ